MKMVLIKDLQKEIDALKERNRRVEADKAWETSWVRKVLIAILTYAVMVLLFYFARLPKPFLNSLVPTLAFLLSTLTLQLFKKAWLRKHNK